MSLLQDFLDLSKHLNQASLDPHKVLRYHPPNQRFKSVVIGLKLIVFLHLCIIFSLLLFWAYQTRLYYTIKVRYRPLLLILRQFVVVSVYIWWGN